MAKRITTDAKIVLERAGYHVEYVYEGGKVVMLSVWKGAGFYIAGLTVNAGCWIENSIVEDLIEKAK
jgi:hypothetical protein